MATFTATSSNETLTGGGAADEFVVQHKADVNTDTYNGGGGLDKLWVSKGMMGIDFPANEFDFSNATILSIEELDFNWMMMPMPGQAIFKSSQFGTGLISNNLVVKGAWGLNDITVNLTPGNTNFSAAGWTFPDNHTGAQTLNGDGIPVGNATSAWGDYIYNGAGPYLNRNVGAPTAADVDGSTGLGGPYNYTVDYPSLNSWPVTYRRADGTIAPLGSGDTIHLLGSAGNNQITGAIVDTIIDGKEGADNLTGLGADDIIYGGDGNDSIDGGNGANTIYGDGGDDEIYATGASTVTGGAGNDTIYGGVDDAVVYSGNLSDYTITVGAGNQYTIVDKRAGSPDGADTVWDVAGFTFANGSYNQSVGASILTDQSLNRANGNTLTFSSAYGNNPTVSQTGFMDKMYAAIWVVNGTLSLASTNGLTIVETYNVPVDPAGVIASTFGYLVYGGVADINVAMDGMVYTTFSQDTQSIADGDMIGYPAPWAPVGDDDMLMINPYLYQPDLARVQGEMPYMMNIDVYGAPGADTTPPTTTIGTAPPSVTNSSSATFSWTGDDGAGSGVNHYEYSTDNVSWTTTNALSVTLNGFADGAQDFYVRAVDNVGNVGGADSAIWTVDTVAPTVAITSAGGAVTQAVQTVTGAGEAGTTVTVYEGANALGATTVAGDGSWTLDVTLTGAGTHSIVARDSDAAGNVGESSAVVYTLQVVDNTPSIEVWNNSTAPLINGSDALWRISGTATAGAIVKLYTTQVNPDGSVASRTQLTTYLQDTPTTILPGPDFVVADASGHWEFQTNLADHVDNGVSATAIDALGAVSSYSPVYQQGGHHSTVNAFTNPTALAAFSVLDGYQQDTGAGDTLSFTDADVTVTDADFAKVRSFESLQFAGSATVTLGANALAAGIGGEVVTGVNGGVITGTGATSITDSNNHALNIDATLLAAGSTLTLAGAAQFNATGGGGGDTIDASGATGMSTLSGGDGADLIKGGSAADALDGSAGDDTFVGGAGSDTIHGGAGSDTIDYSVSTTAVTVRLQGMAAMVEPDPNSPNYQKPLPGQFEDNGTPVNNSGAVDMLYAVENVIGGSGADVLYGDGAVNVLFGGAGNDQLVGNRSVYLNDGDVFDGGAGIDRLYAGKTMIDIDYTDYDPWSRLDFSNVTLLSIEEFAFNYMLMPMPGTATFSSAQFGAGKMSNNLIVYGAWDDNDITVNLVDGDSSFDASGWTFPTAYGDTAVWGHFTYLGKGPYYGIDVGGNDTVHLTGSAGANTITGTIVADMISGAAGDDTLTGGGGADALDGGADTDTAVFSGAWSDYAISEAGGVYTIVDNRNGSPTGADTVSNVELFQFGDGVFTTAQLLSGDNIAPTVVITSAGGPTNQASQTVTGTGEAGTTVTVLDGATTLGATPVAGDGSWSFDATLTGEGEHSITATDVDAVGNVGASAAVVYTLDTIAPAVSLVTIPPDTTTSTTATFIWAAGNPLDVASYRYSTDNGATWTTTTGASVTLNGLSLGAHSFQVEAVDAAGNMSAPAGDSWTIESAVSVTVNPFSGDNFVNGAERLAKVTLTGSYSGFSGGGAVSYAIVDANGVTQASGSTNVSGESGAYSLTVPADKVKALLDGAYTLNIAGTDSTATTGTASETFMVDRLGPTVFLTSRPPEETNQAAASFTFAGADGGAGVKGYLYSIDGGSWTATKETSVTLMGFAAGMHSFEVRAVDKAGNLGAIVSDAWKVDLTPFAAPTITGTTLGPPGQNTSWLVEGGAARGATVTIYQVINDVATAVGSGVAAANGAYAVQTTADQHVGGMLYAVATDPAGNDSAPSMLYYQGGLHADVITLDSPADLANVSFIDGYHNDAAPGDILEFSSPATVVDADFAKIVGVENLQLTGASGATLGAQAAAAGVTNVFTGDGDTFVQERRFGAPLWVDGGALAGHKLTLSGAERFTVNNLDGDLDASALRRRASASAEVIGDGRVIVGSRGDDAFTATNGGATFTGGLGADSFDVTGHTGADVFIYNARAESQNGADWDHISGFDTASDALNFAQVRGLTGAQGELASTTTKVAAHEVAWTYDAGADQTHIYANNTGRLLSQTSMALMRVDLAGDLSAALSAGNFQFTATSV